MIKSFGLHLFMAFPAFVLGFGSTYSLCPSRAMAHEALKNLAEGSYAVQAIPLRLTISHCVMMASVGTACRLQWRVVGLMNFDGEKRAAAWKTYKKLADRVALAVFDDTNVKPGQWDSWRPPKGTVAWTTQDEQFAPMLVRERPALALLEPLKTKELQGVRFQGGLQALTQFHFTIVRGGGWRSGGIDFAHSQSP